MNDIYVIDECFKRKTFENLLKSDIYAECRRMEKADVYEWVYNDELKIQQLQQERDKYKSIVEVVKDYIKENARNNCWIDQYEESALLKKIKELEEGNSNE